MMKKEKNFIREFDSVNEKRLGVRESSTMLLYENTTWVTKL